MRASCEPLDLDSGVRRYAGKEGARLPRGAGEPGMKVGGQIRSRPRWRRPARPVRRRAFHRRPLPGPALLRRLPRRLLAPILRRAGPGARGDLATEAPDRIRVLPGRVIVVDDDG